MLRNFSHEDLTKLKQKASLTGKLTKDIVISASNVSTFLSLFLNNSKARDKFLAMFQYYFDFTCACAQYSSIDSIRKRYKQNDIKRILIEYNIKESISSARKVFRILRGLDEIKGMSRILRSRKPIPFKIISILTYTFSFLYYLSDNALWLISVLIQSKAADKSLEGLVKDQKNRFSLWRVVSYLTILAYSMFLRIRKNRYRGALISKDAIENNLDEQSRQMYYKKLVKGRRKLRFLVLETVLSIMRFLMLVKSLKLPGYDYFDPVFVSICGLISASLGLFKALFQKKIVIEMKNTKDDQKDRSRVINSLKQL